MDDLLRDFIAEAGENLAGLDHELAELGREPADARRLQAVFRRVRSLAATCGFLELPRLERLARAIEQVLRAMRRREVAVCAAAIADVQAAVAVIRAILAALDETGGEPAGQDHAMLSRLQQWEQGERRGFAFPVPVFGLLPLEPPDEGS